MAKDPAPATPVTKSPETKGERFRRLAQERMPKVLARIASIGNLANPNNYDYSKTAVAYIVKSLETAVANVKNAFANPSTSPKNDSFPLPE